MNKTAAKTFASKQTSVPLGDTGRVDRAAGWVEERRRGLTVTEIARREGVSSSLVSKLTHQQGPFPRHPPVSGEIVHRWVSDRRAGVSVTAIARRDDVDPQLVKRVTAPHGPFPRGRVVRWPDEPFGLSTLAAFLGVPDPTVCAWHAKGLLPPHDAVTESGRLRWKPETIEEFVQRLSTCPRCGARAFEIRRHIAAVHKE